MTVLGTGPEGVERSVVLTVAESLVESGFEPAGEFPVELPQEAIVEMAMRRKKERTIMVFHSRTLLALLRRQRVEKRARQKIRAKAR
jgi:hypothetical protein